MASFSPGRHARDRAPASVRQRLVFGGDVAQEADEAWRRGLGDAAHGQTARKDGAILAQRANFPADADDLRPPVARWRAM